MMKNAINWFEIPVENFERAKAFYEYLFQCSMEEMAMNEFDSRMAFLPADPQQGGIGGSIVQGPGYKPSREGALIYLNGGEDLSIPLARVEAAGGHISLPKTSLGPNGFMAHFTDSEGNKVAFHSMQ